MIMKNEEFSVAQTPVFNTLEELRKYNDERFIHLAYRTMLGREPDSEGLNHFLANIRKDVGPLDILIELRDSEEGKARYARGVEIEEQKAKTHKSNSFSDMPSIYGCVVHDKPTLIMDMYVLGQGVKTGIYRVCDEILRRVANSDLVSSGYYVDRSFSEESLEYLRDNGLEGGDNSVSLDILTDRNNVFFVSPFGVAPTLFRENPKIKNIHIIYDLIAIKHPEYFTYEGAVEVKAIMDSLTTETIIFVISEYTKKDLLEYRSDLQPEQITVLPLAADSRFRPVHDKDVVKGVLEKYSVPDCPYFLSVATVEIRKNFEGVIRSFYRFLEENRNSNANLVITGTIGWKTDAVESVLHSYPQGEKRVIFTGYVSDEDLPGLYNGAIAFIYLSRYEGFGLPPLEAMACGIPVITSDNSSLPEVVGDAGIMVNCDDVDSVALSMKKILEDDEFRCDLVNRSLARASSFNWDKSSEIFLKRINCEANYNIRLDHVAWPRWSNKLLPKTGKLLAEGGLRCRGILKSGSKERPLISYVTVVRNNEACLERTIKSVQDQTYANVEHVILDGASTDNTLSIIQKYANIIDYYASEDDGGLYDALNKAIGLCRGELICVLNSDDWLPHNAAEIVAAKYSGEPCELILGAADVRVDEQSVSVWQPDDITITSYFTVANCCHNAIYATRGVYLKSGKYDTSYKIAADFKWIMKCFDADCTFTKCSNILVNYSLGGISGDSLTHIEESKRIAAERFPYLSDNDVSALNYIFYPWKDSLNHAEFGSIQVAEVFLNLRIKYGRHIEFIGILNRIEGKSQKIAYVDHSYHKKTVSTKFLSDLLAEDGHQVDFYWDESWQGGEAVRISELLNYDAIVMFQRFCDLEGGEFFSQIHPNIIYVPMLDQFGIWKGPLFNTESFWRMFQGCKVLNFSNAMHGLVVGSGIRSKCFRYYLKPSTSEKKTNGNELHGFMWIRRQEEVSWHVVRSLIGNTRFDSFHIHLSPDPGTKEIVLPDDDDVKRHNITFSEWFEDKKDFDAVLDNANVFFAPRMEEGIGQSFLEAFSRGQCVVAPDNGTMNEYIQNGFTGLLYDWENPQPLDFCGVEMICARARESNEFGYNEWLNSREKIIDFILMKNNTAYYDRFNYFQ